MADWMRPAPSPSVELWRPDGPAARAAAAIMANVAAGPRPCAEALPPKRRDAQARGEVQVMARTGPRIEARRHIFKRPGVPYGN